MSAILYYTLFDVNNLHQFQWSCKSADMMNGCIASLKKLKMPTTSLLVHKNNTWEILQCASMLSSLKKYFRIFKENMEESSHSYVYFYGLGCFWKNMVTIIQHRDCHIVKAWKIDDFQC